MCSATSFLILQSGNLWEPLHPCESASTGLEYSVCTAASMIVTCVRAQATVRAVHLLSEDQRQYSPVSRAPGRHQVVPICSQCPPAAALLQRHHTALRD